MYVADDWLLQKLFSESFKDFTNSIFFVLVMQIIDFIVFLTFFSKSGAIWFLNNA